jgi:hypothetical protein
MTSNEIATREAPSTMGAELVRQEHTDGWIPVLQPIMQLANAVSGTEFVPAALRDNPEAVGACILFGREIDVAPMHALQNIHIIDGRPSISAEQMRAMVLAAGHEIAFGETSGAKCEIKGRRKGSTVWTVVEWTAAMADAAQLLGKKNWIRYRGDMLIARASAKLCRMIFADVVRGMRTTEELEDDADNSAGPVAGGSPQSATTKVSRAARGSKASRGAASDAGSAAAVPGPPPATPRAAEIVPPPPPAAPTVDPAPVEDTPGEGPLSDPDTSTGTNTPPEELDDQREFIPDAVWADAEAAAEEAGATVDGPVDPKPKPMHTAQTKALQARFKGLGFTDEPDDREARLSVASTILGRGENDPVDTFRAGIDGSMTYDEAQAVLSVLAPARSRDDVLAIMVKIAQDRAAEDQS